VRAVRARCCARDTSARRGAGRGTRSDWHVNPAIMLALGSDRMSLGVAWIRALCQLPPLSPSVAPVGARTGNGLGSTIRRNRVRGRLVRPGAPRCGDRRWFLISRAHQAAPKDLKSGAAPSLHQTRWLHQVGLGHVLIPASPDGHPTTALRPLAALPGWLARAERA
jgi:hypothetical protein